MDELPDIKTSSDVLLEKLRREHPDKPYDLFNFMYELPRYKIKDIKFTPEVGSAAINMIYDEYLTKTEHYLAKLSKSVPHVVYHKFLFAITTGNKSLLDLPESTEVDAQSTINYLIAIGNKSDFNPLMSSIIPCFSLYKIFSKKSMRTLTFYNHITRQSIYALENWREKNIGLNLKDEYVMYDCMDTYKIRDDLVKIEDNERFFRKLKLKPYNKIKANNTLCDKIEIENVRKLGKFDFIELTFNFYIHQYRFETKWRETHSLFSVLYVINDILNTDGIFVYKIRGYFFSISRDIFYILTLLFDEVKFINCFPTYSTVDHAFILCTKIKKPCKKTQKLLGDIFNFYINKYPDCGSGIHPNKTSYITKLVDIPQQFLTKYDALLNEIFYSTLRCIINYRTKFYDKLPIYYSDKDNIDVLINEHKANVIYYITKCKLNPNIYVTFNKKDLTYLINNIYKSKSFRIPLLEKIDMSRSQSYKRYTKNLVDDIKDLGRELFITKRELDILNLDKYDDINKVCRPSNFIKYIIKKKYNISVSQAFLKMLEMLHDFPIIDTKFIKVFHLCEAPGQFILSFDSYCNRKKIRYEWNAQSLNFNNKEINKKYPGVLDDKYRLIHNYPEHWLYGVRDSNGNLGTGDITDLDNIFEYSKQKYDIVTSDCGLSVTDDNYGKQEEIMNFINYSQFLTAMLCLNKEGNYIYKTFLPLSTNISISIICFLHDNFEDLFILKPTLNPASSEVYIFAKNFKGISADEERKLINLHRKFKDDEYFHMNDSIMEDLYNIININVFDNIAALKRNVILYYSNYSEDNKEMKILDKLKDFNEKQAYIFINKYLPINNLTLVKPFDKYKNNNRRRFNKT